MDEIVICKWCGKSVYFGDMIWLNGKCLCPDCYKLEYKSYYNKDYPEEVL